MEVEESFLKRIDELLVYRLRTNVPAQQRDKQELVAWRSFADVELRLYLEMVIRQRNRIGKVKQ